MKKLFTLICLVLGTHSYALDFYCQTQHGEKSFLVGHERLHFETQATRSIASVGKISTIIKAERLSKVFELNNEQYQLVIGNVKNPQISKDFLTIENAQGHKVTYPLICESL